MRAGRARPCAAVRAVGVCEVRCCHDQLMNEKKRGGSLYALYAAAMAPLLGAAARPRGSDAICAVNFGPAGLWLHYRSMCGTMAAVTPFRPLTPFRKATAPPHFFGQKN